MSSYLTEPTSTTLSSSNCSSRADQGAVGQAVGPEDRESCTAPEDRERRAVPQDRRGRPVAIIACGALGAHVRQIAGRRGWPVQVHCLPSIWHNSPRLIAPAAERLASELLRKGLRVALAYADCGTYG